MKRCRACELVEGCADFDALTEPVRHLETCRRGDVVLARNLRDAGGEARAVRRVLFVAARVLAAARPGAHEDERRRLRELVRWALSRAAAEPWRQNAPAWRSGSPAALLAEAAELALYGSLQERTRAALVLYRAIGEAVVYAGREAARGDEDEAMARALAWRAVTAEVDASTRRLERPRRPPPAPKAPAAAPPAEGSR